MFDYKRVINVVRTAFFTAFNSINAIKTRLKRGKNAALTRLMPIIFPTDAKNENNNFIVFAPARRSAYYYSDWSESLLALARPRRP